MTSTRSLLRLGITELRRRPGTQRDVQVVTSLPDLGITSAQVPDDADLVIDATLEAIEGGITVTGTVEVPWVGECRRCLDPVTGTLVVELSEVFEPNPSDGETYPIEGEDVDLEPVIRDAALLHLPLAPLCREDCAGPAPESFPAAVAVDDEPTEPPVDTRWAGLDALRFDDEGDEG
jgi:uncharacterized protein